VLGLYKVGIVAWSGGGECVGVRGSLFVLSIDSSRFGANGSGGSSRGEKWYQIFSV
jgi:hypothetical protein